MALATDVKPSKLSKKISFKWNMMGGKWLQIKELQSPKSKTILA
jgi:hypothetical protein